MASLNKVILIGRFGKDPEVTSFESGNKKVTVTLATSERYRDRDNNWIEQTDWHNIVVWGNLANDIAEHRRNYVKGDLMYVEGKLRTRQYNDQQGNVRYVTEVIADKMMQMAPAKPASQSSNTAPQTGTQVPQNAYQPVPPAAPDPFADENMGGGDLSF